MPKLQCLQTAHEIPDFILKQTPKVLKNGGGRGTMAVKALAATVDTGSKNGISSSLDACEDEESIEAEMYGDRQDDNNDDASSSSRGNNNNSEDAAKRPRLEYVT
uniref:Uncharacterized protein n=1 Tax=Octactis speculum TaxID=3111310 RepID=A0A7S2DAA0_9STRA|mmetsp:Transcript_45549/g.62093  ORF Transcript_45549/g.62093 Transcript_45549/m.62093 type:complete len:105 (+) Transcript_45549:164-478(+)